MSRIVRVIAEEESMEFLRVNTHGFAFRLDPTYPNGLDGDEDRRFGVFDDGVMVGVGRNFSMTLTMPGGARVGAGGVSWIAVHPLHRRRGVMSALIEGLVADSRERGEIASILTASEGSIYWNRGYGPATWAMAGDIDLGGRPVLFPGAGPSGRLRLVSAETADLASLEAAVAPIFERALARPGMASRPRHWWGRYLHGITAGSNYAACAIHTNADGIDDGYVIYKVSGGWDRDLVPNSVLEVQDFITASAVAQRALWQHLLDRDLVRTVRVDRLAASDPIRLMLNDGRSFRTRAVFDRLWIRPINTYALLSSRTWDSSESVVVDVEGEVFRVCADGVERSTEAAELSFGSAALGAAVLGGTDVSTLVHSGRAGEHREGAARRAATLFRSTPEPIMLTSF